MNFDKKIKKYFMVVDNKQQGPFSIDELKEMEISNFSLVWTIEMDNWEKAINIEELKSIIKIVPPPIPNRKENTLKVEAVIIKNKRGKKFNLNWNNYKNDVKSVFMQILYGLLISIISFYIFYYHVYKGHKYDNFSYYQNIKISETYIKGLILDDFPFVWYGDASYSSFKNNIKRRRQIYIEKSIYKSLYVFLIASGFFIFISYLPKKIIE